MAQLRDIIVSRVRSKLLKLFFDQPDEIYYVRQLVRLSGEEINAVRRELANLETKGLLAKEPRGNRLYYGLVKDYGFYNELLGIVAKTFGLGRQLIKQRNRLGRIKFAMVSGRFVRRLPYRESRVDLIVIGQLVMQNLASLVREEEKRLNREINYTAMTIQEFNFRKSRRDPFILEVLRGSRVMIIGDEQEMLELKEDETKNN